MAALFNAPYQSTTLNGGVALRPCECWEIWGMCGWSVNLHLGQLQRTCIACFNGQVSANAAVGEATGKQVHLPLEAAISGLSPREW